MLSERDELLKKIRDFFAAKNVLEVETPLLCNSTITAPYLHSFSTKCNLPGRAKQPQTLYLQTSPEFAMKKLLANGSGDIYQICKAFRDEERGKLHSPEFTILEWYRIDFDHHKLMDEMDELLQFTLNTATAERFSYAEIFAKYLQINCFTATTNDLMTCAKKNGFKDTEIFAEEDHDTWLQILLTHFIEPHLGKTVPAFIYDYPPSQAALAKIRNNSPKVAERFEVYINGIELANGFHELNNETEQRERFLHDLKMRQELGLPQIPLDEEFLKAVGKLPNCSGVALGVDRLLLLLTKANSLSEIL